MAITARPVRPMLIAGGGIGGLAAALALAKAGVRSRVLERKAVFEEAGAGIQIGPNGVAVLRAIGVAGVLAPMAGVPGELEVRDGIRGTKLATMPLGDQIEARHGAPYWTVHRADLHAALLAVAQRDPSIHIETGFAVDRLEATADGVRLIAEDGRVANGAAAIGADGLWSKVRSYVAGPVELRPAGWSAYRTVIGAGAMPAGLDRAVVGLWLAAGAHAVHYPVRGGLQTALVVILPQTEASEGWARDVDRDALLVRVAGFAPDLVSLVQAGEGWKAWSLVNVPPLARWSNGGIALLGDAAHPVLPFLASGGVLALEDAAVLAACVQASPGDYAATFDAYAKQRRVRVLAAAKGARRNGGIYHMSGAAAFARNLAMKAVAGPRLLGRYDWLYGWKPPVLGV